LRYLAIGIVSLPFLYLLSFGPACWFVDRRLMTNSPDAGPVAFKLAGIYCPLVRLSAKCAPLKWYATVGRNRARDPHGLCLGLTYMQGSIDNIGNGGWGKVPWVPFLEVKQDGPMP